MSYCRSKYGEGIGGSWFGVVGREAACTRWHDDVKVGGLGGYGVEWLVGRMR